MEFIQENLILIVYLWGSFVYGTTLVARLDWVDIFASYIAGLAWPITLPARILHKILR